MHPLPPRGPRSGVQVRVPGNELIAAAYSDLTVLDVSALALTKAKYGMGDRAMNIEWIVADITK
jgi:hypothetical protein